MSVFDDLPELIGDLITDLNASEGLGFAVTYTSITPGTYNTANGQTAVAVPTVEPGVIAFEDTFTLKETLAGLVQTTDRAIGIPAALLTVAPKPTDTVTLADGSVLTVVRVRDTAPGSASVLHQLHLRAA